MILGGIVTESAGVPLLAGEALQLDIPAVVLAAKSRFFTLLL